MSRFLIALVMMSGILCAESILDSMTTPSIRAMGRGNAGVAMVQGADGLLSNPAGLADGGGGIYIYNFDSSEVNTQTHQATLFHRKSFGVGWRQIQHLDQSVDVFSVGLGQSNAGGLTWGIVYKSVQSKTTTSDSKFWTGDFGLMTRLNHHVKVGVVGQDLIGSKGHPSTPTLQMGGVLEWPQPRIKWVVDALIQQSQTGMQAKVRYGLEAPLGPDITLRTGSDNDLYSFGASLHLGFLILDYAYQWQRTTPSNAQAALGFRLGRMQ